ncbi:MAG: hypothetical protein INH41_02770 [Myxococcaceae bacterium]|nr:hypothetical protein [Myxococcaceae bacterium]
MSPAAVLAQSFDALVKWAMTPDRQDDVVAARAEYTALGGEVFEEDRQLELRLAGFLEFYVCDRIAPWAGVTPARARYLSALASEPPAQAAVWRAFTDTWHGLFRVFRLFDGGVRLEGLSSGTEVEVVEQRPLHGVSAGDVLEARLVPLAGDVRFSGAWVWHPHEAAPLIVHEASRRRLAGRSERELLFDCARRSLKADRYRQIAIARIYDFGSG